MTPQEIREAYNIRKAYDAAYTLKPTYEGGRLAGFLAMLPHVKKNSLTSPQKDFPFTWEQSEKTAKPKAKSDTRKLLEKLDNANWKPIGQL